jgi:hypothetical protein
MAYEKNRNIQDATYIGTFTLPVTAANTTSCNTTMFDLGTTITDAPEAIEWQLEVGALSDTIAPAASTAGVDYSVEYATTSAFSTVTPIWHKNFVGTGSGVAATTIRGRLPSNCGRFVRAKVKIGTTCTDASAVTATFRFLF